MIPKRVLIPPDKPTSLPKEIQKPIHTDWDSPSSYTGTVKRRPPSIESPKTPVSYDVSSDKSTITASNLIQISKDDKISPQEVIQGNDIFTQKRKGNKLSERKRHTSNESESTISTSDQIESKPISSTLRRKSKLKLPSSSANPNSNLLPSTSTAVDVIVSRSNLPKLSQAKKTCAERPKYTLAGSQSVEKEKQKSNFSTTLQVNRNYSVATATTAVESKQVKNQFYNSELNKNKNKRALKDGTVQNKTSYSSTQPESHRFQTFRELYRDFPANYASTTVDGNICAQPPPYCYPPSPTASSSTTIYKQKNVLIETQKKIRFEDEDESIPHNRHIVVDTSAFGVDRVTRQNANDSQHLRNKFTLPKFEHSPKHCGNRFLTSSSADCETNFKKYDNREILRANANDYVMFNPTRKTLTKMNCDHSPSNDILAKPEFSSSVFKNIPVRPRKGIPHLENYCLFDPSTDFVNEKESKKNEINDDDVLEVDESEFIEEIIYEDQEVFAHSSDDGDLNNYCGRIDATSDEATTSSSGSQSATENVIDLVIESTNADPIECDTELKEIAESITTEKPPQNQSHRPVGGVTHKKLISQNDKLYRHSSLPTSTSTKLIRHKYDESLLHQSNKICENVGIENQIEVNLSPSRTSSTSEAMLKEQKDTLKQSASSPQLQNVSYKCSNKALPLIESNYVLFYPAPVHSRNQYKIKPPRPISTHSDADSGFLSPATPDGSTEIKFNPAVLVLQQCDSIEGYIEIYTDWANYYLERVKSKKKVADLSADCRDGLLLAEVIEAVTTFKVPDLVKKPKNQQQMYDNVNSCLNVLRSSNVGGLETITTNDICTGRLKAVLALFFALSRYKQASKQKSVVCSPAKQQLYQQHTQQPVAVNATSDNNMTNRQLPVPYSKVGANGGTAIPLPATVLVQRRCPPDKVRPLPPTPGHSPSIPPGLVKTSGVNSETNSRPASPPSNGTPTHIPKGNNSFRPVQSGCKIPASPYSVQNNPAQLTNGNVVQNGAIPTKHSMLDKLKLFNKEKSDRSSKTQTSKRTSSSSGFSSARSERSDSSLSLNDGQNQQLPKLSNSKKPDICSGKSKSKLLSTKSGSKDSVSGKSKSDRKDKSPARNEEPVNETKIVPPRIQKIPTAKIDSKNKSIPPPKKLEIRSESKSSLSQIQIKQTQPPICTNIPKPMAFIKGTTKPTIKIDQPDHNKSDKMNISNQNISSSQDASKFQYAAPITAVENQTLHHMHQQLLNGQNISMTDSSHSKSTHSSSTGLHSNSSESSVIYRPSSESGSDALYIRSAMSPLPPTQNVIPNRKIDNFEQPAIVNEKQQKFHTVPSKMLHGNGVIFEEERQMTVLPMRPLLRGYNSHVTLPTRGMRGQNMVSEYCEDIGQGYCSDGDALRKIPSRYSDIENGYMSEGGSYGIHPKHMNGMMRTRSQLPTTIEERCRSSRGENLDCMGTVTSPHTMEMNGCNRSQQRSSNRENWGKIPEQHNGHNQQAPSSPTSSRKDKGSPSHSRRSTSSSKSGQSRTKGVPQSFGYVKRTNGSATGTITATDAQQAMMMNGGRTAHVSAVPRSNKVKVSGGTQTCSSDLQSKVPPNTQHRSFSLTGPASAQLSQSIRERLSTGSHSLPKQASDLHVFQHRISNRGSVKLTDGSLSDTQAYAEVKTDYSSYAMWLKHSNTASSRLSEGDSLESLGIGSPRGHKMMHRESPYSNSPRLNRSNSIRSTKSEKMYPSMLSRGPDVDIEPYYCLPVGTVPSNNPVAWSQPTSPTPPNRGFGGPLSPTHAGHRLTYPKKNDDAHGSAASLLSGGSSLYGSAEERQLHEVRRLKRELVDARDQVMSLSSQLSTNAHVVAAFEQSLTNMTQRLQQLSATADRKDSELTEMRQTIELLRKQSIQAGLTSAHMHSMNEQPIRPVESNATQAPPTLIENTAPTVGTTAMQRHLSSDSMCSLNSVSSGCSAQDKKKKKGWLRSSFTKAFSRNAKISKTNRHHSTASNLDHLSSLNSSGLDASTLPPPSPSRSPLKMVTVLEKPADAVDLDGNPIVEDLKKQLREKDLVLTDIRLEALSSASQLESLKDTVSKMRQEMMNLKQNNERLKKLVTSRSLAGSEVSLGGPISPSGSMGEPRRYSLADGNLRPPLELPKSLEETEEENIPPAPAPEPPPLIQSPTTHSELTPPPALDHIPAADHISTPADDIADHTDGKKIAISVYLAQPESFAKYAEDVHESDEYYANDVQDNEFDSKLKSLNGSNRNEFVIAFTYISGKTTWQNLDYIVRKTFKDYVARIDPGTNLGLNTDSITSYHLGEAKRGPEMGFPELLPCGYIVGSVKSLYICLQGVGSLAFDSLIPRSIVHRYISLLTEHRRLILCGPSGTGKSYLARKLAEFLVARSQRGNPSEAIATFNVDHKSSKELRQYLGHIAEQASMSNGASELPSVIILDNLHHASALGDVFQVLLSAGPAAKLPCIIGTMSQATCNTTNLQLHHNFRWVLTANHMEPVKGFLARFLRRRLYSLELSTHNVQPQLAAVLAWLPTVWQHINRFLETHSSSDVTIGPRLFLSCPLDLIDSQVWFTDIWNYHLEPYLVEAVREGVQLYGRRVGAWVDPSTYIRETYPWPTNGSGSIPPLRLINAEDVGLEGGVTGNLDSQDPLLNMLMRLQEAANYSGNQEQESDCASLDSNITQDSSAGAE